MPILIASPHFSSPSREMNFHAYSLSLVLMIISESIILKSLVPKMPWLMTSGLVSESRCGKFSTNDVSSVKAMQFVFCEQATVMNMTDKNADIERKNLFMAVIFALS